jgi:hypothetical protein
MVWEELDGRRGAAELAAARVVGFDGVTEPANAGAKE